MKTFRLFCLFSLLSGCAYGQSLRQNPYTTNGTGTIINVRRGSLTNMLDLAMTNAGGITLDGVRITSWTDLSGPTNGITATQGTNIAAHQASIATNGQFIARQGGAGNANNFTNPIARSSMTIVGIETNSGTGGEPKRTVYQAEQGIGMYPVQFWGANTNHGPYSFRFTPYTNGYNPAMPPPSGTNNPYKDIELTGAYWGYNLQPAPGHKSNLWWYMRGEEGPFFNDGREPRLEFWNRMGLTNTTRLTGHFGWGMDVVMTDGTVEGYAFMDSFELKTPGSPVGSVFTMNTTTNLVNGVYSGVMEFDGSLNRLSQGVLDMKYGSMTTYRDSTNVHFAQIGHGFNHWITPDYRPAFIVSGDTEVPMDFVRFTEYTFSSNVIALRFTATTDHVYSPSYDGSLRLVTENALYDKIESIPAGISADTATNIAAFQSKISTNSIAAESLTGTVADARIASTIARDSEVTAATNTIAAESLTGTVADARIAATIARDAEVTAAIDALNAFTNNDTRVRTLLSDFVSKTNYTDRVFATNSSTLELSGGGVTLQIGSGGVSTVAGAGFSGIGANLTGLNASQLTSGTVNEVRLPDNATVTGWILGDSTATSLIASGLIRGNYIVANTNFTSRVESTNLSTLALAGGGATITLSSSTVLVAGGGGLSVTGDTSTTGEFDGKGTGLTNAVGQPYVATTNAPTNGDIIVRTGNAWKSQAPGGGSGDAVLAADNVFTGSNTFAAVYISTLNLDTFNVDDLNATNLFTQITNAPFLGSDANGKLVLAAGRTSAQLATAISDESGTAGSLVFSGSPSITTPSLTTPRFITSALIGGAIITTNAQGSLVLGGSALGLNMGGGSISNVDAVAASLIDASTATFSGEVSVSDNIVLTGSIIGSVASATNVNLNIQTNVFTGPTNTIALGQDATYTTTANCSITGFSGVLLSQAQYAALAIFNNAGSDKTLTIPSTWKTPDGLRSYTLTNGIITQISVRRTTDFTNASVIHFY